MITERPTDEQFSNWLKIWQEYSSKLKPNRRTGIEVIRFIKKKYKTEEIKDAMAAQEFAAALFMNGFQREKIPEDTEPNPVILKILKEGPGVDLYENQDEVFKDVKDIIVIVDTASGCYSVEGSSKLWDELCIYQGVDKSDLENPVTTGIYVELMKKAGKLQ